MSLGFKAIYDDDILESLKSISEYDNIIKGKCKCMYCKQPITIENITQIIPYNSSVKYVCNQNECIIKTSDKGK